jgi:hypothetical protein
LAINLSGRVGQVNANGVAATGPRE